MKLGQLVQSYHNELVVTPQHEKWLRGHPNPEYSDAAKAFLAEQIGKPDRDRTKSFSASGQGLCPRRRQFEYLGLPKRAYTTKLIQVFHNGTYMHLRWQMAGISARWIYQAEYPAKRPALLMKGTLDALLRGGGGLELKSINSNGFRRVNQYGPLSKHLAQMDAYMLMTDIPWFSLIYEDKDTQEYREWIVHRDEKRLGVVRDTQAKLVADTVNGRLNEIKDLCWAKEGTEYLGCPFREICPTIGSWQQAQEAAACESSQPVPQAEQSKLRVLPTSSSQPG